QILEMYLNQIYFGQGAYGIRTAALTYFGKDLADITLAEAALLAGLPKSPNNYSPFKNPDRAKKRQEHVLARMEEAGFITADERQEAVTQTLAFRHPGAEQIAPYFIEHIRQQLVGKYGETMVYKGGLEVYTTLNIEMQKAAELAVMRGLRQLDKRQGWRGPLRTQDPSAPMAIPVSTPVSHATQPSDRPKEDQILEGVVSKVGKDHVVIQTGTTTGKIAFDDLAWARRRLRGRDVSKDIVMVPNVKTLLKPGDVIEVAFKRAEKDATWYTLEQTPVVEGALIAIDPRNGAIRALVGGYDFARSEFNRAMSARRQPGSAFKPLIYATAFNAGLSPATIVVDSPVVYEQPEEERIWKPENYEKKFHGVTTLRDALIHSRNAATVRLLERVGVRGVIDFAKNVGIGSPLAYDLSLALGSSSVTLVELASAYSAFANQGLRLEPYTVSMVQSQGGETLEQTLHEPQPVVSKETAYLLTNVLQDVIQRGTGQAAKVIDRPVAGKTGTTNDFTDAWFLGFTPNLVTGVWVGFDDLHSLGETESGAHAALPIWIEFMQAALQQLPVMPFEIPEEIVFVRVDPKTGLLAADQAGEHDQVEIFAKGSEPTQSAAPATDPAIFYVLDQGGDGAVGSNGASGPN
ncbi:MAG TPA: PBP1A family penicillin-binding protein, partial [Nitrospirales bacterium]|nr:PBP1A family penicillin-binding protein [Nitrospirales bacterium]